MDMKEREAEDGVGVPAKQGGAHLDPICFIHSPAPRAPRALQSLWAPAEILALPFPVISPLTLSLEQGFTWVRPRCLQTVLAQGIPTPSSTISFQIALLTSCLLNLRAIGREKCRLLSGDSTCESACLWI